MTQFSTTKLSSKGQIVIPEEIRQQLGLKSGTQLLVMGDKDVVILKVIKQPSIGDFKMLITKIRKEAKKAGLSPTDLKTAIAQSRKKK